MAAGHSSITFWLRRCREQSRSPKITTLPCLSPKTWNSIWRGWVNNFSIYNVSSPNADAASFLVSWYASAISSALCTGRIPRPPPPADAFNITGYPIFSAVSSACSNESTAPSDPGTTGRPHSMAVFLALTLSPILVIISGDGPIQIMPCSSTLCAKSARSDKNPYPGWIASEFVNNAAVNIADSFK